MPLKQREPGVGPTKELNLRVSVAVLIRVLFKNPVNGKTMLALERTASLRKEKGKPEVVVKAKPFGGGVRLLQPRGLKKLIGEFNYDSERSREEGDFRIQINPEQWEKVIEICQEHLKEKGILDPSPVRELTEEFEDSLGVRITPDEYRLIPRGMKVEDLVKETNNIHAQGHPTVRIYYIFDAMLKNPEIIAMVMDSSRRYSDINLKIMADEDARQGGKGRVNAVLTVFLDELKKFYRSIPKNKRSGSVRYEGHQLDGNVPAILDVNSYYTY